MTEEKNVPLKIEEIELLEKAVNQYAEQAMDMARILHSLQAKDPAPHRKEAADDLAKTYVDGLQLSQKLRDLLK